MSFSDMVLQLRLEAEASGATAELKAAATEVLGLGDAAGQATNEAVDGTNRLARGTKLATGQVGNLTAQFNDIGVMLAAGQNPLQLAIQQGTQITQVIGPLGAAGAVGALKSALINMVNPISLITLGSIAAGAAMIQWLTGAAEKTETLEDNIANAKDAIQAFDAAADTAQLSISGMLSEFGSASPELQAVLKDLAALGKIDAYQAVDRTADSIRDLVLELSFWDERSSQSAAQDFLGLYSIRKSARQAGAAFARNLEILSKSEEPAQKLKAALDLRAQLLDATGGIESLNGAQRQFYDGLVTAIRDLSVLEGNRAVRAQEMLITLKEENSLRWAAVRFGEDSVELATLRAAAEREAFEETLANLDATDALKEELRLAFEWGLQLAEMDMAEGISAAGEAAAKLAKNLGIAVSQALSLQNLRSSQDYSGRGADPRGFLPGGNKADYQSELNYQSIDEVIKELSKSGGGGGARASAQKTFEELVADASSTMAGLQLAIAAVNEKVEAGLLTAAEGQQGVDNAIRGAAGSIGDLIPQLERAAETAGPDAAAKIDEMRKSLRGLVGDLKGTSNELSKTFSDSLGQSMTDFQSGAKSAGEAFSSFGNTVLNQINRIIAQRFTDRFITPVVDSFLDLIPGILGGGASAASRSSVSVPDIISRPGRLAAGGIASQLGSPRGTGAGPARGVGGGRDAAPVNIAIHNNAPGVEASASESGNGQDRLISIMIEKVEAGVASNISRGVGPVAGQLSDTFGLSRQPR